MSKSTRGALQQFSTHTGSSSTHQQFEDRSVQGSSSSSSFRTKNADERMNGTDEDLGRFYDSTQNVNDLESIWSRSNATTRRPMEGEEEEEEEEHFSSEGTLFRDNYQDGQEIQSLLSSTTYHHHLATDWETELTEDQARKSQNENLLPSDPTASKPRELAVNLDQLRQEHNLSPNSINLLHRLNELDENSRDYLQSLLAQSETSAIEDYLTSSRDYSDDVWGTPVSRDVGRVLKEVIDDRSEETTKEQALKRLRMLMNHLNPTLHQDLPSPSFVSKGKARADEGYRHGSPQCRSSVEELGSSLQHIATSRPSELGPKRSSAMSTPPEGLEQSRINDFNPSGPPNPVSVDGVDILATQKKSRPFSTVMSSGSDEMGRAAAIDQRSRNNDDDGKVEEGRVH